MNQKVKEALLALSNRRIKVDIPNFQFDVYIRPIPYVNFFELLGDVQGETEKEKDEDGDIALCAFSMVDEDGEQLLSKEEYKDWIKTVDYKTAIEIVKARNCLNNFRDLNSEDKKKL